MMNAKEKQKKIVVVPHTHWDREWYQPFQKFRHKLVKLIDTCLSIDKPGYTFMLDGQTIVLEDYLDIKPENKEILVKAIREGRITVGPWYLLPDEFLAGAESFIRNLERAYNISKKLDIPLMKVGHLPDCFGHTRAVPQILADLTSCKAATAWRGVPPSLTTVPFTWKSHASATASIPAIYLAHGYGNMANANDNFDLYKDRIKDLLDELEPFSPVPAYLLMNGSDHLFPQPFVMDFNKQLESQDMKFILGNVEKFADVLQDEIKAAGYTPPVYAGEFRSFARAHLLHDTLSTRMWIKQWNQKNEDLLCNLAEPLATYSSRAFGIPYPSGFLDEAWKWHLQNQPHDSICGCSIDQVHEEMAARDSWATSIAESVTIEAETTMQERARPAKTASAIILNPTSAAGPVYAEIETPPGTVAAAVETSDGKKYNLQQLRSLSGTLLETTANTMMVKMLLKLASRKIAGWYINEVKVFDGAEPGLVEVRATVDKVPVGEFDVEYWKKEAERMLASGKYKKAHVIATQPANVVYGGVLPLAPWAFTRVTFTDKPAETSADDVLVASADRVDTRYYSVKFNKDGTFELLDKRSGVTFPALHVFEDWGDRGDEYTFGRLGPEKAKVSGAKRKVTGQGAVFAEIKQTLTLELFKEANEKMDKREGKADVDVETTFRFFRALPRIDIETKLVNTAKDHRLRVRFDLPFKAEKIRAATHFGTIERGWAPEVLDKFAEQPTGIMPQKRYVRVDAPDGKVAITVANKGLPEVELAGGNQLAITLLRCVGWLSRGDIPERPVHAGPGEKTPGAQELGKAYTFDYSVMIHPCSDPLHASDDFADTFCARPKTILFQLSEPDTKLLDPIIQGLDPWIRVSSLRMRDGKVLVTAFNLADTVIDTKARLAQGITQLSEIKVDGSVKKKIDASGGQVTLHFEPHEIKMCSLG
ncbi:MAG: glycoside hydrolase family 38 C-terminal domain-containing protein [Candidatus Sigynarchaeota archaeon]